MITKSILIAHNNKDFVEQAKLFFQEKKIYRIDKCLKDGNELLKLKHLDDYHIVIVKDTLTEVSGLFALEKLLKKTKSRPEYIILLAAFFNSYVINKCKKLGIIAVNSYNITIDDIFDYFYTIEVEKDVKDKEQFCPQVEIDNLLKKIGLLRTYVGYTYFDYVLNMTFAENTINLKGMNNIYHAIAEHYNVSISSVEKAMRSCIKSSFTKNYGYYANLLFGHNNEDYPTTSTFLQVSIRTLKERRSLILNNQTEISDKIVNRL